MVLSPCVMESRRLGAFSYSMMHGLSGLDQTPRTMGRILRIFPFSRASYYWSNPKAKRGILRTGTNSLSIHPGFPAEVPASEAFYPWMSTSTNREEGKHNDMYDGRLSSQNFPAKNWELVSHGIPVLIALSLFKQAKDAPSEIRGVD